MDLNSCIVCGAPASIFLSTTGVDDSNIAYCEVHAPTVSQIASLTDKLFRDDRQVFGELAELTRKKNEIPFEIPLLPSGQRNPVFGRWDLRECSIEDFLALIEHMHD